MKCVFSVSWLTVLNCKRSIGKHREIELEPDLLQLLILSLFLSLSISFELYGIFIFSMPFIRPLYLPINCVLSACFTRSKHCTASKFTQLPHYCVPYVHSLNYLYLYNYQQAQAPQASSDSNE